LHQLDLGGSSLGDEGALALLSALEHYNLTLASLNLNNNAKITPVLSKSVDFILTSRMVLNSFRSCLDRPLEKRLMPLVIHGVQQKSIFRKEAKLAHCQETRAGPVFLLVRTAALNDSKVIKVATPSKWL
jgi:hypothetical protein